eukprot:scaffold7800_cov99-Amphora_coffeaeformis.AAC.1
MGGLERVCRGGGVPEMARGLVQWVGRNQGCDGGHSDGVDDGGAKIANREGSAGREWRGRGDRGWWERRRAGGDGDLVVDGDLGGDGGAVRRRRCRREKRWRCRKVGCSRTERVHQCR